jgi:hypothetical protein
LSCKDEAYKANRQGARFSRRNNMIN